MARASSLSGPAKEAFNREYARRLTKLFRRKLDQIKRDDPEFYNLFCDVIRVMEKDKG